VELRVRNQNLNEDEQGTGTNRNGMTHYFIFPGDTGADATFLLGKDFSSTAVVSFELEGIRYSTAPFTLAPHTH
jgi:hypothetical protein